MFGDDASHKTIEEEQLESYVNTYGPGMVIYWYGYIKELDKNSNILICSEMPRNITTLTSCLP